MAKTNFTKVEGILDEGLRKMTVDHLLDLTKAAPKSEDGKAADENTLKQNSNRSKILLILQRDMKFLDKGGHEPYELFGIDKKTIIKYLKNPGALSAEEWEEVKENQIKVRNFRKECEKNSNSKNDEDIIEQQRRSHKTKRFNINDKWLPLT
jgi:hypothetical protein